MNKIDYSGLTTYLFWSEMRSDLNRYLLGPIWWVLEPCLYVAVFYFAFAHLRGGAGEHVFLLLCGISVWHWITSVINQGANSLIKKKGILKSFSVHPIIFPLSTLLVHTFKFAIVLVCVMVVLWINDVFNFAGIPSFLLWILACVLVCFSYAVNLSLIIPFAPDLQLIISRAMMLLMFLSGVIFPIDNMSPTVQEFLFWNPFAHLIESGRKVMLYGESLDAVFMLIFIFIHIPLLLLGFFLLGKLRGEIPKRLV
ncbi:ABC transporter permease [Microbulbifer agarilyticus]|uniref:ABC transporter permease n=1 Tax=Microbulbifer agarilyticus TaxID=260552 RepID=UPI001CD5E71A|nr:ABC transporter permease [Microbulbifer agarilyticus]MCA0893715.1 ABC transporter permease [Microbulbifer agarilyticus]